MARSGHAAKTKLRGASLLTDLAWTEIAHALALTTREVQVIQAVFDNLHKAEIAKRHRISGHTVHTHLNRLFIKLNIHTRTELVLRIIEQMITLTLAETAVLPPMCPIHHEGKCSLQSPPTEPPRA